MITVRGERGIAFCNDATKAFVGDEFIGKDFDANQLPRIKAFCRRDTHQECDGEAGVSDDPRESNRVVTGESSKGSAPTGPMRPALQLTPGRRSASR